MAFPTTGILDNFNRTDANPLDGSWTNGWWGAGNVKLLSNQMAAAAAGWSGARWNAATYGADCEAYLSLPVIDSFTLGARMDSNLTSPSGYYLEYDHGGGTLKIRKLTSGTGSTLGATLTVTFSNNDKVGISVVGTTITAWRYTGGAWSELGSRTDSTYSGAGYLAVGLYNTAIRGDDFGGGTVVSFSPSWARNSNVVIQG